MKSRKAKSSEEFPVPDEAAKIPSPFDVRTIEKLIALMTQHELTEMDLREGALRIRLRRGPLGVDATPEVTPPVAAARTEPPPPANKPSKQLVEIKSPTPGTFYSASSPDAEPYVRAGSRVTPTTVVCLIEAMKIFNEIQAECNGVIAEVLVQNQQPVEWGQVLFRVDPTG
jgi:acetyl-CoA carboxylase biotin carboxyl carrier protein